MAAEQGLSIALAGPAGCSAKNAVSWGVAIGFGVFVAGLLAHGSGHVVELAFPVLALFVGAILFFQHPTLYLWFTWWLWFLTPEVRRLVDYQTGWSAISPIMIAPFLVAGLAGLTLLRCMPQLLQRPALFPFALVLAGLNYGYTIGIVHAGPLAASYGLLTWIVPVAFGFHVAAHWRQYPLYRDAMQRVFLWGVLAMGIYGLVQFFVLPPWDAEWMRTSPIDSVGGPHPLRVRIWSTMNSPQPFALAVMAGLLIAFAAKGPLRLIAGVPGYLGLLLSLVRTAWLGWVIGVFFLLARARGVQKIRLLVECIIVCLLSLPLLLLIEPVADRVTGRLETMQDVQEDKSLRTRLWTYADFASRSVGNVIGEGIGSTNKATKLTNDARQSTSPIIDSGVLELPFTLGWPGTLLYVGGLGWLLSAALGGRAHHRDLMVQAAGAVVLAILTMTTSYNTLIGPPGMVFWSFLGLMLSARTFHNRSC